MTDAARRQQRAFTSEAENMPLLERPQSRPSPWPPEVTPACRRRGDSIPAHAATEASLFRAREAQRLFRARDAQRRRDGKPEARQEPPGLCPERHLPLSRQTPRPLSRAEQKKPPKWRPDHDWRSWSMRPGDTSTGPAEIFAPMPLGGQISKQVVEQYVAYVDPEPLRETGGGWAANAAAPPPPPPEAASLDTRDAEWPLDEEVTHWCNRAAAQRAPKGTLAIVSDFLDSPLAAELLPVER